MKRMSALCLLLCTFMVTGTAWAQTDPASVGRSPSVPGTHTYFRNIEDGDIIDLSCPLSVQFGLEGMGIAPASVVFKNTGHLHLLIDVDASTLDMNIALPFTDNISHFGLGQTETCLELAPGEHTLQILLADHNHVPHDPPVMSEKITITVK
jgi:hypothetical protein